MTIISDSVFHAFYLEDVPCGAQTENSVDNTLLPLVTLKQTLRGGCPWRPLSRLGRCPLSVTNTACPSPACCLPVLTTAGHVHLDGSDGDPHHESWEGGRVLETARLGRFWRPASCGCDDWREGDQRASHLPTHTALPAGDHAQRRRPPPPPPPPHLTGDHVVNPAGRPAHSGCEGGCLWTETTESCPLFKGKIEQHWELTTPEMLALCGA